MRIIGGLFLFLLAVLAFHWCAGEIAVQMLGREVTAYVDSVSRGTSGRHARYTAHYQFVTEDKSTGYGTCASHQGAEGGRVRVRYFRHDPTFNTPTTWWYAGFWMLLSGGLAWPLALWSARVWLHRRVRRFGDEEEEDEEEEKADAVDDEPEDEATEAPAKPAVVPPVGLGPVSYRNTWAAAWWFSLVVSAAALALNYAWYQAREQAFVQRLPTMLAATAGSAVDVPALPPVAPRTRGATVGNVAAGSALGFDGPVFYTGLWRDYEHGFAPSPGLYRFNLDGTGRTPVGDSEDTERIYTGVQVQGDWVYYLAMDGICRIRKDGTKHRRLTEDRAGSMAVVGDWIYYQHSILNNAIFRLRLDGGGAQRLCRETVGSMCVADDGWIYYVNQTDGGRLWRMQADGTARARLADQPVGLILVVADTIWFTDPARDSALCRMTTRGTEARVVADEFASGLQWADGWIYFRQRSGALARCQPDGSRLAIVAPQASSVLIHDGQLYLRPYFDSPVFLRTDLDGSHPRTLTLGARAEDGHLQVEKDQVNLPATEEKALIPNR